MWFKETKVIYRKDWEMSYTKLKKYLLTEP